MYDHEIEGMKQDIIDLLKSIDKDRLDLCSLKDYAEVIKIVSEIRGQDYIEVLAQMVSGNPYSKSTPKALGPISIRDMKEHKEHHKGEEEEDDD